MNLEYKLMNIYSETFKYKLFSNITDLFKQDEYFNLIYCEVVSHLDDVLFIQLQEELCNEINSMINEKHNRRTSFRTSSKTLLKS